MNIPNSHQTVMPYLMLNSAATFIDFVTQVFNAELTFERKRDEHKLMHAEVRINDCTIMFCDTTDDWKLPIYSCTYPMPTRLTEKPYKPAPKPSCLYPTRITAVPAA